MLAQRTHRLVWHETVVDRDEGDRFVILLRDEALGQDVRVRRDLGGGGRQAMSNAGLPGEEDRSHLVLR